MRRDARERNGVMEHVATPESVAFKADTVGRISGWWAIPAVEETSGGPSASGDRPIELITVQLPTKTSRFFVEFRELSRVRSTESSGFMERAMGGSTLVDPE